jgi:hypothetical protein
MRTTLLLSAAALALASGTPAHAGLLIEEQVNGGAFNTLCSAAAGSPCAGSGIDGGVNFVLSSADSNSPGTPALAALLSDTVSIANTRSTPATITLLAGDTGFDLPAAPPDVTLESAIGTTTVVGGVNTLSFVSCVDTTDSQNVCPGTFTTPAVAPDIAAVGSAAASDAITIAALAVPYAMTEDLVITLDAGSRFNYSASTRLETVSEPSALALLSLGVLFTAWRRRRLAS